MFELVNCGSIASRGREKVVVECIQGKDMALGKSSSNWVAHRVGIRVRLGLGLQ